MSTVKNKKLSLKETVKIQKNIIHKLREALEYCARDCHIIGENTKKNEHYALLKWFQSTSKLANEALNITETGEMSAYELLCESYSHVYCYLEEALEGFKKLSRTNKSWQSEEHVNAHVEEMIRKLMNALKIADKK